MKRFTTFTLMMFTLMLSSLTQADYTIYRFSVCDANGDQELPDIDGDWIVWVDERAGTSYPHIYGYTLAEPNEIPICIDSEVVKKLPAVSGNTVVWEDRRNSQRDIYAFDLLTRNLLTLTNMPFNDGVYQQEPDVCGDLIVYRHKDEVPAGSGNYYDNIWVYDNAFNTTQAVSTVSTIQYYPAIEGTIVAWVEMVGSVPQVFYRDISSTSNPTERVNANTYGQWYPSIYNGVIVWAEDRGGQTGRDIYGLDLNDSSAGAFVICEDAGNQNYPAIAGDIVVWQDESDGLNSYDIWAIDLAEPDPIPFMVSDGTGDNQRPAISENTIVWQRKSSTHYDIFAAELLEPSTVTLLSPNGGKSYLAASSIDISWTSSGPVDEVLIEFSSDGGANWADVNTVDNTGSYLWEPIADVDSTDCWIRISNPYDSTAADTSNAAFEIYQIPNSITVTAPAGGEQYLAAKSAMNITWTSVGPIADVRIEFSEDGLNWQDVAETTPNDGQYTWAAVPDLDSQTCHIRVSDVADAATKGLSYVFTIFQCDQNLTADLTGDCVVNLADLAELSRQWLTCGNPYDPAWCFE